MTAHLSNANPSGQAPLLTHWTPLHTETLPLWGARLFRPGPSVLVDGLTGT